MKSKSVPSLSLIFSLSVLITACKHEPLVLPSLPASYDDSSEDDSNGNGNGNNDDDNTSICNPDTVYFQNDILPLFISNCAMSSCHDAQSHEEGIVLDSYSNINSTGEIQAFNIHHGKIYENMITTDPDDRMPPPPRPAMDTAQIRMIATWINQGALNNACNNSGGCDTSNVTYSGIIIPLLQAKCVGCHNNSSPGGSVNLSSYAGVRVVALNGKLPGSVNHTPGFSPMPKNIAKLPDCQIAQIRIWIQHGSLNN